MNLLSVKQSFGLIGNSQGLNRAIETAVQVAPTDLSVLVTGESGVGKETIPQIIHAYSTRKHNKYVAVNCGAIPEGTMDSELFGHVKGSFTGATGERKGYFEEANEGTIFLDEVAEMPMQTQVKLLRVLESGEYMKVGSSKVEKTNVRVVAATNVNIPQAIEKGKFREDLYYRLNTVPISIPPLRQRKEDIHLLFRKFASDFAEKYRMPGVRLTPEAQHILENYHWHGNIRQLKNITEQVSILETNRDVDGETLMNYLPNFSESKLPMVMSGSDGDKSDLNEREILYKVLFDMRQDVTDLKKIVLEMLQNKDQDVADDNAQAIQRFYQDIHPGSNDRPMSETRALLGSGSTSYSHVPDEINNDYDQDYQDHVEIEESLSLEEKERELIKKALEKHNGKRKYAAQDLGISERTLYRKIKEYKLN